MNFAVHWRQLVMQCVSIVSYILYCWMVRECIEQCIGWNFIGKADTNNYFWKDKWLPLNENLESYTITNLDDNSPNSKVIDYTKDDEWDWDSIKKNICLLIFVPRLLCVPSISTCIRTLLVQESVPWTFFINVSILT